MRRAFGLLLVCVLASCPVYAAKQPARRDPEKDKKIAATTPICTGEEDCAAKWESAQLWVVKHASYKIQTVTNVLLETYGTGVPYTSDPLEEGRIFAQVTKEPVGGGSYRIVAKIGCVVRIKLFGTEDECVKAQDLTLDFNATVAAAGPRVAVDASQPEARRAGVRVIEAAPGCSVNAVERLRVRGLSEQAIQEICAD